jgi:two-component system, chemotaxis family, protein-glutamate methylesterase/glutaminase
MTTATPLRVLIVDDSAYMRKAMREMLEGEETVTVVGTAWNGLDALEQVEKLNPDVVITDLYMPEMDGIGFIKSQMRRKPIPIVLCSSADSDGDGVLQAMDAGVVEFVQKPTARALDVVYDIRQQLILAVQAAAAVVLDKMPLKEGEGAVAVPSPASVGQPVTKISVVMIGVSTGGPRALRVILPRLPADLPIPIIVALHMPPGYTATLAENLNKHCLLEVVESAEGMEVNPGRIILAQAGTHTRLMREHSGRVVTRLNKEPRDSLYHPSIDVLFQSGATAYGSQVLGIVLTGMGNDGTAGSAWVKSQGGVVFTEDEKTSVVYGMPRSVVEAGLSDRVLLLDQFPDAIMELSK